MAFCVIFLTVLLVGFPAEAHAWGIGVHLQLGSSILNNLPALPLTLRALLEAYPHDFLYGCISADITLGKKFTHYLNHCHSWRMGRKILAGAGTDPQRACAYGYLAHLAADTVAHSYYVPYKMVRTFNTLLLKHAYWEMRFESGVDPGIWILARTIARKNFQENDNLMRGILSDTLFSFSTNKRLFNSILLLSRLQQYQKMLRSMSRASKYTLDASDWTGYMELAGEATLSVLTGMEESPFWKADPTGERALNAAKLIRRNLNLLWLDGKLSETEADEIFQEMKGRFRAGITEPDHILELLS